VPSMSTLTDVRAAEQRMVKARLEFKAESEKPHPDKYKLRRLAWKLRIATDEYIKATLALRVA
jgi:hypothetical protein